MRWWKTKTNVKGIKKREKKSREKVVEIIAIENNIDKMTKDPYIMNKIKAKLGLSIDSKADIVIVKNLSEKKIGMSNDIY